jgi:hypothetical protein
MPPILVVQQICFRMSKEHRRSEGFGSMNEIPEVARMPLDGLNVPNGDVLHHVLLFGNRDASLAPDRVLSVPIEGTFEVGCVSIAHAEETVIHIGFTYDRKCAGAPTREWAQSTLQIRVGEWAQIRYNGRFSYDWTSYWYYEKMVINIALPPTLREDVFTNSEPNCRFSLMSELY